MIATTIAFGVGIYLFIRKIQQVTQFSIKVTYRGVLGILVMTLIMSVIMSFVKVVLPDKTILTIVLAGGVGFVAYLVMAAKLGYLEKLFGDKGTAIRRRLHI